MAWAWRGRGLGTLRFELTGHYERSPKFGPDLTVRSEQPSKKTFSERIPGLQISASWPVRV